MGSLSHAIISIRQINVNMLLIDRIQVVAYILSATATVRTFLPCTDLANTIDVKYIYRQAL